MIAIVIVNWNGHRDTVECLESLMRLSGPTFRILVSDNASEPESTAFIQAWAKGEVVMEERGTVWQRIEAPRRYTPSVGEADVSATPKLKTAPMITLLRNQDNLGFAGGNNVAIRYALRDPEVTHVWLLNNDTVCHPEALEALAVRAGAEPDLGLIGSTLLYYDDPDTVQGLGGWFDGRQGRGDQIGKLGRKDQLPGRSDVEAAMTYVIGAAMFASRAFLETIGLMDERYFLYFEETDWSERNAGRFGLGWEPASIVFHKEGGSSGTSQRTRPSDTSIYYANANLLRFTWRYYQAWMPVVISRVFLRAMRFATKRDVKGAKAVALAFVDFSRGRYRRGPVTGAGPWGKPSSQLHKRVDPRLR